ncbi:MAG: ABC transporter ATP-binding protein [Planctomycetota bacterium]
MENTELAVQTEGLTKVYAAAAGSPAVRALDGLNLEIRQGETFGLIGPNGAGKTTLLRILSTLLAPTRGRALLAGHDCAEDRLAVCKQVGFMPELFYLYEEMKVWEYLEFFAGCYGIPLRERGKAIDDVIELTDLGVRRDSYCETLSKGMRQRLLLAKTLVHDPEVLILDEPTSGMDPQARIEFRNVIKTLAKMGKTTIISSHILSDLASFCTSVGIMEKGQMRVSGTISELQDALHVRSEIEVSVVPGDHDPIDVLRGQDGVSRARRVDGAVIFGFDGSDERRAEILALLVRSGIKVTDFHERRSDLEQIFLQVGATEVQ